MKFQEIINSEKAVLVDFYADWCGPCKMMTPILENLKSKLGDSLTILKVDVDRNPGAARLYEVRGVPTLIIFKKGEIKWRHSGVVQGNELERILNAI
jgi:thioredoxin 1